MPELFATTRRSDGDVDLLGFAGADGLLFTRDGRGFGAQGVARRVPFDGAAEALAAIEVDDEVGLPGCGAVAFGALPFVGGAGANGPEMVIPERILGRADDGTRWSTVIGPERSPEGTAVAMAPASTGEPVLPSRFDVSSSRPPGEWCDAVAEATARMRGGLLEKVVLAREVVVTADHPIPLGPVLRRLQAAYAGCYLFAIDGFVGASPELLVSRSGDIVRAQPMAGTTARRGNPQADARAAAALLASATYRHEHQVTIDMVHDTLLGFCSYLDYEAEPTVVALANVAHLATMVEGRLSQPAASVLELVRALHPTPAVCGRPRDIALTTIAELEQLDRGRYAGAVGWVDAAGNGQWAVSIRCAQVEGNRARVFAGNGIVAGSDPSTELAETRAKLQALLGAIVRP